jgi:hypothetical protein
VKKLMAEPVQAGSDVSADTYHYTMRYLIRHVHFKRRQPGHVKAKGGTE